MAKISIRAFFFCERSSKIKNITCNKMREFSQFTDVSRRKKLFWEERRMNDGNQNVTRWKNFLSRLR